MKAYVCSRKYLGHDDHLDKCPCITALLSYKLDKYDHSLAKSIYWARGDYKGATKSVPKNHFEPVAKRYLWSRKPNKLSSCNPLPRLYTPWFRGA